jgi:tight adherence protein C
MDLTLILIAVNSFAICVLILCGVFFFPQGGALVASGMQYAAVKASPSSASSKLQYKLDLAGNPANWSVEKVFTLKGMLALGFTVASFMLAMLAGIGLSYKGAFLVALFGVLGFFLPNILLFRMGVRRQEQIQRDLPDRLDLLAVSMQAGLAFDGAMAKVANSSNGPLDQEFARMLQELRFGESKASVLRGLINRSNVDDLRYVVQALIQATEMGIPVADVLTQQSREMRTRRRQRAEEKAQKVALKILFPTLFCIFPTIMVVVIFPAIIRIVDAFTGVLAQ